MMNMPRGSHFSTKSLGKMCTQAFDDFGFESQCTRAAVANHDWQVPATGFNLLNRFLV